MIILLAGSQCVVACWTVQQLHTFCCWSATSSLSATNSMYCFIRPQFIPIKLTGSASVRNYIHRVRKCEMIKSQWGKMAKSLYVQLKVCVNHTVAVGLTSCSILTALQMMALIFSGEGLYFSFVYSKQAKSQCSPSSRLINSLEKVKPGIRPLKAATDTSKSKRLMK